MLVSSLKMRGVSHSLRYVRPHSVHGPYLSVQFLVLGAMLCCAGCIQRSVQSSRTPHTAKELKVSCVQLLGTGRCKNGDECACDGSIRTSFRAGTGNAPEAIRAPRFLPAQTPARVPLVGIRPVDSRDCLFIAVISRLICVPCSGAFCRQASSREADPLD